MRKKSAPVRIAVIGTICWDRIQLHQGTLQEGFGGAAYSILTLAALLESHGKIAPVGLVGKDRYQEVLHVLKAEPGILPKGLKPVSQKSNTVSLVYRNQREREEILQGGVPSLPYQMIKPFLGYDYCLVNMISGWDIELATAQKLRKGFEGKIYLDLHSLTLGMDEKGRRFPQKPKEWEKWIACADYLQLNQKELETVLGKKLKQKDISNNAAKLIGLGPKIVLVTLGESGCFLAYKLGKKVITKLLSGKKVSQVKDSTGCGDIFGAAFLAKFVSTNDPVQSAEFANYLASLKATFSGLDGLQYFNPLDLELD